MQDRKFYFFVLLLVPTARVISAAFYYSTKATSRKHCQRELTLANIFSNSTSSDKGQLTIMTFVFMIYLLCAITDCPPPVTHNDNNPNSNPSGLRLLPNPYEAIAAAASSNYDVRSGRKLSDKNDDPVASTSLGDIQGRPMESRSGRLIAAFEGIPYANPPTGQLRFRNPVPIHPWRGRLWIANYTRGDCLQLDFGRLLQVRGVEDCLYLNVYTPSNDVYYNSIREPKPGSKSLLPVIVYIHGGGWISHSGTNYGPKYLLDKDVILVTFNYRLGILGFLSTGDKFAFGNFGLKDQVVALKWVRDHIVNFGGDPNKITLMGESTGAGSAALHILSPMTRKTISIHGAIMLSGTSMNHWAVLNDTFLNTRRIARRLNCPTGNSRELVNCLRALDPYMVVGQQLHLWKVPVISRLIFGPVVETTVNNPAPFLIETPEATYTSKPETIPTVPVIAGINQNEGAIFAANVYLVPFLFLRINSDYNRMSAYIMAYDNLRGINATATSQKISNYYFDNEPWSWDNREKISQALGDRTITTGVHSFLNHHSLVASTYGYFFTYPTKISVLNQVGLKSIEWGVTHGDELPFIFSMKHYFDDIKNAKDLEISEFMVNICVNFARDRQPFPGNVVDNTTIWSPILNPNYMEVLDIKAKSKMVSFPYQERMKFWKNLGL